MEACLGIYLGDKIIKYAKLTRDTKSKQINLASCGTKYIIGDKKMALDEIITQTGSAQDNVSINLTKYSIIQTEVLKQLGKSDTQSAISLEVSDYATGAGINEKALDYRYMLMDSLISNANYTASIAVTDKANIDNYQEKFGLEKLSAIYPKEYILNNLVQSNSNYVIANVDEKTQLIFVVGGKIKKIVDIDVSMEKILDDIATQEGSYSKACDLCKSINVLSDDSLSPEIEGIIEPTIQDLLNRIKTKLDETKINCERIYLNGLINLFINIDVLFEQFFSITTEKLRPYFINIEDMANISEVIEANDAVGLAYVALENKVQDVNFLSSKANKGLVQNIFSKENKTKIQGVKKITVMPNINMEKIENALLFANLTAGAVLAGYVGFSAVYNSELTKMEGKLTSNIQRLQDETVKVKQDTTYVKESTNKYVTFNNYISETVEKIREGKIGKYTTYNVANFMQKIAKYIPTNVQIETISSDDNKSVSIVAKSTSYAELGYFISQLKLQGILDNIRTGKVENGSYVTVTIGGDLP